MITSKIYNLDLTKKGTKPSLKNTATFIPKVHFNNFYITNHIPMSKRPKIGILDLGPDQYHAEVNMCKKKRHTLCALGKCMRFNTYK